MIRLNCPEREVELDLALHTGMRRGELFGLGWENVDLDHRLLTVIGKGGYRRFIPINATARAALETLHARPKGSRFVCREARRSNQRDWRRWFEEAARAAGLEDFCFHDLRHTFASRLVMAGIHLRVVQELLGHKSITMTERYAHLSPKHLMDAVDALVPTASQTAEVIEIRRAEESK